eukprot:TRINITY_DN10526_c0_g1_i1.p1 TRINITY_DN10526_c0_g1~~TRINITY_DN10526_c0_g1_i1.p1  ORF type:complete len:728 (+),score=57.71 TRINITY_DN10526_c0_g1_i1:203-2185(+)
MESFSRASDAVAPMTTLRRSTATVCKLRSLPSRLDLGMLRATPISEVLSGFGIHFKGNAAKESDYDLSEPVEDIDDFLSHDWRTGRLGKVITLCYIYNRYPACIASCIAAIPIGYLGSGEEEGCLARFICPFVWLTFLLFWQRIRAPFRKPRSAFLDKLCINQTDEQEKAAGISGLAGFLRASQRMVVLWSPHYFSRLWCTYELAAWCHIHGEDSCNNMRIFPVPSATLHFLVTGTFALKNIAGPILWYVGVGYTAATMLGALVVMPMIVRLPAVVSDIIKLPRQLEAYRIRQAKCFCCTHDHVHPETGDEISCDRDLIYATLQKWTLDALSGSSPKEMKMRMSMTMKPTGSIDDSLDDYDKIVQYSLLRMITSRMNSKLVVSTYMECVSNAVPAFWSCCDLCSSLLKTGEYHSIVRWLIEYSTVPLFLVPLGIFSAVQVAMVLGKYLGAPSPHNSPAWIAKCLSQAAIFLVYTGVMWVLWVPGLLMHQVGLHPMVSDALMMLRYAFLALITRYAILRGKVNGLEVLATKGRHDSGHHDEGTACRGMKADMSAVAEEAPPEMIATFLEAHGGAKDAEDAAAFSQLEAETSSDESQITITKVDSIVPAVGGDMCAPGTLEVEAHEHKDDDNETSEHIWRENPAAMCSMASNSGGTVTLFPL